MKNVLELLSDGGYHVLDELQEKTGLSQRQIRAIVEFLTEYGFTEMSEDEKMKISNEGKKLFVDIETTHK